MLSLDTVFENHDFNSFIQMNHTSFESLTLAFGVFTYDPFPK